MPQKTYINPKTGERIQWDGSKWTRLPQAEAKKPALQTVDPPEGVLSKIGRGGAIGAFEGLGIKPSTDPMEVITGTLGQFGKSIKDLVGDTYRANAPTSRLGKALDTPITQGARTAIDLVPTALDRIATGLETTGKQAYGAAKNKDWEGTAENVASLMTQIAMLRGGKKTAQAA